MKAIHTLDCWVEIKWDIIYTKESTLLGLYVFSVKSQPSPLNPSRPICSTSDRSFTAVNLAGMEPCCTLETPICIKSQLMSISALFAYYHICEFNMPCPQPCRKSLLTERILIVFLMRILCINGLLVYGLSTLLDMRDPRYLVQPAKLHCLQHRCWPV